MTLTDQERDVARLVAEGWSEKQIGVRVQPPINQQRVSKVIQSIATKWRLDRSRSLAVQITNRLRDNAA